MTSPSCPCSYCYNDLVVLLRDQLTMLYECHFYASISLEKSAPKLFVLHHLLSTSQRFATMTFEFCFGEFLPSKPRLSLLFGWYP